MKNIIILIIIVGILYWSIIDYNETVSYVLKAEQNGCLYVGKPSTHSLYFEQCHDGIFIRKVN